jgi:cytochrome c biogenesis protein CcmG/thiol:disulfide interchange protein DsbE
MREMKRPLPCLRIRSKALKRFGLPVLALVALSLAACGGDGGGSSVTAKGGPKLSTAGLAPPLAKNIRQANRIIDGDGDLLKEKLASLRGFPIVVNQWASWCEPCRFEFPFFAAAARRHRSEIAFLGIDMQDGKGDAKEFLEELPVPFPSIFDPDASYISSIGGGRASPTTVFIDSKGEVVNVHPGAYASLDALERDIERHTNPSKKS